MANKSTKITDEVLVAALVSHQTIKEAAQSIGVSERTIYSRMRNAEFEQLYKCAKTDILRGTVSEVSNHVTDALSVISAIMHDENTSAPVKLNAAAMLLTYCEKAQNRLKNEEVQTMPRASFEARMEMEPW